VKWGEGETQRGLKDKSVVEGLKERELGRTL
jgi:hypothetical protein